MSATKFQYDNYWEKDSEEEEDEEVERGRNGENASRYSDSSSINKPAPPFYYETYDSSRAPNISDLKYSERPTQVIVSPTWEEYSSTRALDKKSEGCLTPKGGRVAIGMIGIALGVLGLVAYLVIQAPALRHQIGWLHLSNPPSNTLFKYNDTNGKIFSPDELLYGTELAITIIVTVLGIISNALLVYGVSKDSSSFLLPWLIFNVFFVVGLYVIAAIVFVLAYPMLNKLWGLIPAFVGFVYIYFWVKVWELYRSWKTKMKQNKAAAEQIYHTNKYSNFSHSPTAPSW